ncbi:hypothetical protein ACWGJ2_40190 [Streptomyces sp. NPDC054796]
MSLQQRGKQTVVRCDSCDGHPVLPTPVADIDTRKCIRCQGERRWLPVPHPENHLCSPCSRECPECQAPSPKGGRCLKCQQRCRLCGGQLPAPGTEEETDTTTPRSGTRRLYPQTWDQDLCPSCKKIREAGDPIRAVLAALPTKLLRECDRGIPPTVIDTIRHELGDRSVQELCERIERRWWNHWSTRPLYRDADIRQPGHTPYDIAARLIAPADCPSRCEDGWQRHDPDRLCPQCRGEGNPARTHAPDTGSAAQEEPENEETAPHGPPAVECEGRGGACGRPAAPGHDQCPACLGWPWCVCNRIRHDPQYSACRLCRAPGPAPAASVPPRPDADDELDEPQPPVSTAADRPLTDAIAYRPPAVECEGREGSCGRPAVPGHDRCAGCLGWPTCRCGRTRHAPQHDSCHVCRAPDPVPADTD